MRAYQVICLLTTAACVSQTLAAAPGPEHQSIAQLRACSAAEVSREPSIQTSGIVTWRQHDNVIIQCDNAAIFVNLYEARRQGLTAMSSLPDTIVPGTTVAVEGRLIPGGFAPVILPAGIVATGVSPLPPPRRTSAKRFFTGADDCQRVEIEGIARGVKVAGDTLNVVIAHEGRPFVAQLAPEVLEGDVTAIVDARVRVAGVALTQFNTRGELLMPALAVSLRDWLTIVTPRQGPPFEAPALPLAHLAGFSVEPADGHMVRVEGTVIHAVPGEEFYLQDGAIGVRLTSDSPLELRPGDRVEAAGFIDRRGRVAGLSNAVVRRLADGTALQPIPITPDEIVAANVLSAGSFLKASPGDYENCLVTFSATLVDKQATHEGGALLLSAGKTSVAAEVSAATWRQFGRLELGSDVAVTGIVNTDWNERASFRAAPLQAFDRMKLLVRTADDVVVLRGPPWWTPRRLGAAAGGLALLAAAAAGWVASLRRQVQRQAERIAEEIRLRREAAVEFEATLRERNRLAVNLHDTVLQTVTGIGYQVSACKDETGRPAHDVDRHFDLVTRMVHHAIRQLRGTVWALRATAPTDRPLPQAIAELAERLGEEHDAVIDVTIREPLPEVADFVAGNLLLITQEAVLNALRHADAAAIAVRLRGAAGEPATIEMTVRDDGCGFELGSEPNARQGHFGLEGMRERVERLGGTITITSHRGHGTAVDVCVPAQATTPSEWTVHHDAIPASIMAGANEAARATPTAST